MTKNELINSFDKAHEKMKRCALFITPNCNISCKHCFIKKEYEKSNIIISKNLIDYSLSLIDNDYVMTILGGEPFLYPKELKYICKKAREKNIITRIATNGFFGNDDDKIYYILNEIQPDIISISLDEYHQEFIPEETIKNLINKIWNKIPTLLECCVYSPNSFLSENEISKIKEDYTNKLNLSNKEIFWYFLPLRKIGNAENISKDVVSLCNHGFCSAVGYFIDYNGKLSLKCEELFSPTQKEECKNFLNLNLNLENINLITERIKKISFFKNYDNNN
jgi:organic radical activating enzyme